MYFKNGPSAWNFHCPFSPLKWVKSPIHIGTHNQWQWLKGILLHFTKIQKEEFYVKIVLNVFVSFHVELNKSHKLYYKTQISIDTIISNRSGCNFLFWQYISQCSSLSFYIFSLKCVITKKQRNRKRARWEQNRIQAITVFVPYFI